MCVPTTARPPELAHARIAKLIVRRAPQRAFHRCVFGSNEINRVTEQAFLQRCIKHDDDVIAHANALNVPLLRLPINLSSSQKWRAVGAFLGVDTARLETTNWPHV